MVTTAQTPVGALNKIAGSEVDAGIYGSLQLVATGLICGRIMRKPGVIRGIVAKLNVCGSAGQTDIEVRKNGVAVAGAALSFDNALADPTQLAANATTATTYAAGDCIEVVCTAAGTAAVGLNAFVDAVEQQ